MLEKALRDDLDHRRDDVVVATKGGLCMTDDGLVRDSSPEWVRSGVEASLKALAVDHIDVYQVHWPDPAVPFAETAGAAERRPRRRRRAGSFAWRRDLDRKHWFYLYIPWFFGLVMVALLGRFLPPSPQQPAAELVPEPARSTPRARSLAVSAMSPAATATPGRSDTVAGPAIA